MEVMKRKYHQSYYLNNLLYNILFATADLTSFPLELDVFIRVMLLAQADLPSASRRSGYFCGVVSVHP